MLFEIEMLPGNLAVVSVKGPTGWADMQERAAELVRRLSRKAVRGIILDFASVPDIAEPALGGLVDLLVEREEVPVALCSLPMRARRRLDALGLSLALPVFDSRAAALAAPTFAAITLSDTSAVVLCAGKGTRAAPMTRDTPKPMLDIVGRPLLRRILEHLETQGIRRALLNPGHLGAQIPAHFARRPMRHMELFHAHEGGFVDGRWHAEPLGSASTLVHLADRHSAFPGAFVVLCGDALVDIDLPALMAHHRASGAMATLVCQEVAPEEVHRYGIVAPGDDGTVAAFQEKPSREEARSRLANCGIYVFEPEALALLPSGQAGLDIAGHLLPAILNAGGAISIYSEPFRWIDIGCGRDYFRAIAEILAGNVPFVQPEGEEIRPGVWAAPTARVSRFASISGRCHLGPGAQVVAGARLVGTVAVGAGCEIQSRTLVRDSLVMAGTRVSGGALVDNMLVSPDWAIDHRHATRAGLPAQPLEHVAAVEESAAAPIARAG